MSLDKAHAHVGTLQGTTVASHISGKIMNSLVYDMGERNSPRDKKKNWVLTWDHTRRHKAIHSRRTEDAAVPKGYCYDSSREGLHKQDRGARNIHEKIDTFY